jgi:hypothetical protein
LAQNPEAALRLGFERLEEKDIAVCVTAAPSMALAMARGYTPTARARLLGSVIKHCKWGLPYHTTQLQTAIFQSIEEAPESWLEIFGDSFIPAFEKMARNLGIRPSGEILIEFSKKLAPDKQARLLEVVSDWIWNGGNRVACFGHEVAVAVTQIRRLLVFPHFFWTGTSLSPAP